MILMSLICVCELFSSLSVLFLKSNQGLDLLMNLYLENPYENNSYIVLTCNIVFAVLY